MLKPTSVSGYQCDCIARRRKLRGMELEYRLLVTLLLSDFACKITCNWNGNLDIYIGRHEKVGIAGEVIDPFPL